jgi:pyruvate dehydrogenase E1 component alpha subunit
MALAKRKLRPVKAEEPMPSAAELEKLYRDMLLIRRFEEKAGQMYGMGLIGGFCHLYIGEEAVVVGVLSAVAPGDSIITSYRDHGHMLASGMDPKGVMAELTGRSGGYSKGKGGSMHMFSLEKHFYGGHGIVAAQVPIGTGLAFAHKYRNDGGIAVTFLGDGAMNQGQVAESFNMAELWKLPVLYVIENNKYGMGTSVARSSSSKDLYTRAEAFNIPGGQADGMNVLAVRSAAEAAIRDIRAGKGPYVLELLTYRYRGHSMSDPAKYRSKDELNRIRQEHDPIDQMKRVMTEAGVADEARLKEIDRQVKDAITQAAEYAQASPEPDPAELYTDVYVEA